MYILASMSIGEGFAKMQEIIAADHDKGQTWSKDNEHEEMEKIVKKAIGGWKVRAPKITIVINPRFGDFLKACLEMHIQCKREKLLGSIPMQCRLDQACLYTRVMFHPKLWCNLLTTKCIGALLKTIIILLGFLTRT